MRTWHLQGVHRVTWLLLFLLVLALAVFAMAAGFSRLRSQVAPEQSESSGETRFPASMLVADAGCSPDAPRF
jgi:hypothetical protein